jgi:hypothetical protein
MFSIFFITTLWLKIYSICLRFYGLVSMKHTKLKTYEYEQLMLEFLTVLVNNNT